MTETGAGVVIVGAGHAGGSAAAFLRQYGYQGPIAIVGDEPVAPYQRPPLSKAWLKGEADAESLMLRPLTFYAEQNIALILDVKVTALDRAARTLRLSDGRSLPYDNLILATGSRARPLPVPGADLKGVLYLRSAADAEELKAALGPGKRRAVVGGGYIGLEAAASARALARGPGIHAADAVHGVALRRRDRHRHQSRGLGFCVSVAHAEFMARKFQNAGIPAIDGYRQDGAAAADREGLGRFAEQIRHRVAGAREAREL